jgi:hypothetical protein
MRTLLLPMRDGLLLAWNAQSGLPDSYGSPGGSPGGSPRAYGSTGASRLWDVEHRPLDPSRRLEAGSAAAGGSEAGSGAAGPSVCLEVIMMI